MMMPTTGPDELHENTTIALENIFDDDDDVDGEAEMMLIDTEHDSINRSNAPMYPFSWKIFLTYCS